MNGKTFAWVTKDHQWERLYHPISLPNNLVQSVAFFLTLFLNEASEIPEWLSKKSS